MPNEIDRSTDELVDAFGRMYSLFYRRRDPRAHRTSAESLAVLDHLASTGPLTVTEAARHFDRSQAAMSEIIERLMTAGLLDRIADERDRRRHLVWLTPQGRAHLAEERQVLDRTLVARAFEEMDGEDRAALSKGLRAFLEAAERARHTKRHGKDTAS